MFDRTLNPMKNLAREEELFKRLEAGRTPELVRLWVNSECLIRGKARSSKYGWYHEQIASEMGIEVFQRETGGGVVYHDQGNLNWSFLARADGPFHSPVKIFREASDYVVEAIGRLGIRANFFPPNRIDVSGRKVSGMAAKSTARALLVHGTLLLHSDLDKLNKLCVPPPGCPPVANLSEWSKRIDSTAVAAKLTEVLRDSGFDVKTR